MSEAAIRLSAALGRQYSIERELGGGGMSRVFLAREVGLNRDVVIKVLPDDVAAGVSFERFNREIQLAASLSQANIVPLLTAGTADGVPYFTMPFVAGESLRTRLATLPALTLAECVGVLRDVARALSYAHARGVVHRDIKPDNVLLSHGTAVVTDFGIAKALSASRTHGGGATLTQAGVAIGTPTYMAPEQIAGDADVDARADLYAWGCMAYELLTGTPPFVRDSAQRVLTAHLTETPRLVSEIRSDVPAPLARLIARCLEKEPDARPQRADEMVQALVGVFTPGAGDGSVPQSAGGRAAPRQAGGRRNPLLAGGALVLVAVVLWLASRGRSVLTGAPTGVAAVDTNRSIAVLPLANLSGDKADDYFGIGLAEEMTRALTQSGVRVIGRTSAGALLARGMDERTIARELGVGTLLSGSVQRAEGQIRINVSLLSASDGAVRWTERYDRPIANVFAVQDEIARAVATQLNGAGAPRVVSAAGRAATTDPETYALYLQGLVLFNRRSAVSLAQGIAVLEAAVARDPEFARARAVLAMTYAVSSNYIFDGPDARQAQAIRAAQRALATDSTIAEAYAALGWVSATQGRMPQADSQLTRAIALDPSLATALGWHGIHLAWRGNFAEAHRFVARGRAAEPASLIMRTFDAQVYMYERNYAAADSVANAVPSLDSTFLLARSVHGEALLGLGRVAEATATMEQLVSAIPTAPATEYHALLAYVYARAGDGVRARVMLDRMRASSGGQLPPMGVLAATLEQLGDTDAALALLVRARDVHDPWLPGYIASGRYDRLRKHPRGAAIVESVLRR
ncbi:MAG: protein kinase [Gemmatimonadaceae bacterium]|nr:protein kinase [Gemmatimonadaceae bacterium]